MLSRWTSCVRESLRPWSRDLSTAIDTIIGTKARIGASDERATNLVRELYLALAEMLKYVARQDATFLPGHQADGQVRAGLFGLSFKLGTEGRQRLARSMLRTRYMQTVDRSCGAHKFTAFTISSPLAF